MEGLYILVWTPLRRVSLPLPLSPSSTTPAHISAVMADPATDIEKSHDSKEASVDVTVNRGPLYYADGVPRSKGIFGKARFPLS